MKLPLILVLATALIAHTPLHAQRKKKDKLDASIYLFNKDWSGAKSLDDAVYIMESIKENDSLYVCRYYNKLGPMVKQESFLDSEWAIPNGRFCWYNAKGDLDSVGLVYRGRKDSYWTYYRDDKTYLNITYDKGKLVEKTDYDAKMIYYANGAHESFEEKKIKDSLEKITSDTTFKTVQVEAKYNGGMDAWVSYISANLVTPDRFMNIMGRGKYTVIVCFLVNKEGATDDIYLSHSVEWSGDREILNLIKNSPRWQPAQQNGKHVYYRQKQSISYAVN